MSATLLLLVQSTTDTINLPFHPRDNHLSDLIIVHCLASL